MVILWKHKCCLKFSFPSGMSESGPWLLTPGWLRLSSPYTWQTYLPIQPCHRQSLFRCRGKGEPSDWSSWITGLDWLASWLLTSQTGRCHASSAAGGRPGATAGTGPRSSLSYRQPRSSLCRSRSPSPPAPLECWESSTAAGRGGGLEEAVRLGGVKSVSLHFYLIHVIYGS